jgi:hypothetical protein
MAQGGANGSVVLYDKDGNPVDVEFRNGRYALSVFDPKTHKLLGDLKESVDALTQAIQGRT